VKNVIAAMKPHFSSTQGSYYSDDLFFLSLGLHLISPLEKVVLVDLDTELRADPAILYQFFDLFSEEHLFGLAPELSPIYKHVLFKFLHAAKSNARKVETPIILIDIRQILEYVTKI
jgi:xylosyl alpha-1,3-xylosyltransferase